MKRVIRQLLQYNDNYLIPYQRATHTYVIGQPGTGKSRALESWIMQDVLAGHGVGIIDPHGDMFQNLLVRISSMPEVWKRVIILDPCNPKWTVSFNPLKAINDLSHERLAAFLTDIIIKIWKLSTSSSPRMLWLLTNTFLALSSLDLTLLELPRFLLDTSYRESLIPKINSESARTYFLSEFPKSQGAIHQWVSPVLNKIGSLIFDPDTRLMVSGGNKIDFRKILDRKFILLVNLPKGIIGEGTSALLGAFIVAHLQKAALSRSNSKSRNPYFLYLDEFQNYTTDNIQDILSESRKYALSLILAHQYLDQLSSDLRSAVLNTAGTLICFRVGYHDACQLVHEIFPYSDYLSSPERKLKINRMGSFPLITVDEHKKPFNWESQTQVLTMLGKREFWSKKRGIFTPIKKRTLNMPDPEYSPETLANIANLLDISGQQFGKLKIEAEHKLKAKYSQQLDDQNAVYEYSRTSLDENSIPLWGN